MIIEFTTKSSRWKYDVDKQLIHREPLDEDKDHPYVGYDPEWFAGTLVSNLELGGNGAFVAHKYGALYSGKIETLRVQCTVDPYNVPHV